MTTTQTTVNVDLGISSLINAGWQLYKKYWSALWLIVIVYLGIEFLVQISMGAVADSVTLSLIVLAISWVLSLILQTGLITIGLKTIRDTKPEINDLFGSVNKVAGYFMASLVYGLLAGLGFILLIIPGIYFMLKYTFMPFLAVDKKMGVGEAMKASAAMTEGIKLKLLVIYIVISLFGAVGVLALGVGLLLTIPTAYLACFLIYQRLLARLPAGS